MTAEDGGVPYANLYIVVFLFLSVIEIFFQYNYFTYIFTIAIFIYFVLIGDMFLNAGYKIRFYLLAIIYILYFSEKMNKNILSFESMLFLFSGACSFVLKWQEKLQKNTK